jgi:hypothetical protein
VALQKIAARQQHRQYQATAKSTSQLLGASEDGKPPPARPPPSRGAPNETFHSFVNAEHAASAPRGGGAPGDYKPTFTSTTAQIQQHQQMVKQQRMQEQSKQLLEQNKAKHQAMVAQAHAAVQSHPPPAHTPHPPPGAPPPPHKHRHAR